MSNQNQELTDELNRLGPRRYANLDKEWAAFLAHGDFISAPDLAGGLPSQDVVCKMFATDFFRLAAKFIPY